MKILTVSDWHNSLSWSNTEKELGRFPVPDVIFFLGDNYREDILNIKEYYKYVDVKIPIFGIFGNHDEPSTIINCGIPNIHLQTVNFKGFIIGGFGGSVKYKNKENLFTQNESIELLKNMPRCNILLTHAAPRYAEDNSNIPFNDCHSGLLGIGEYIESKTPSIVFHGHMHEKGVSYHDMTQIISCYKFDFFMI